MYINFHAGDATAHATGANRKRGHCDTDLEDTDSVLGIT